MSSIEQLEYQYIHSNNNDKELMLGGIQQDLIIQIVNICRRQGLSINTTDEFKFYFDQHLSNLVSSNEAWKRLFPLMLNDWYNIDKNGLQKCVKMYISSAANRFEQIKSKL